MSERGKECVGYCSLGTLFQSWYTRWQHEAAEEDPRLLQGCPKESYLCSSDFEPCFSSHRGPFTHSIPVLRHHNQQGGEKPGGVKHLGFFSEPLKSKLSNSQKSLDRSGNEKAFT